MPTVSALAGLTVAAAVVLGGAAPAMAKSSQTAKLGTDILDVLVSPAKNDAKAKQILRLIKAYKPKQSVCTCAKNVIDVLNTNGTKSNYASQGGTYPLTLGNCAGLRPGGRTALKLSTAVVEFWAKNARGKRAQGFGTMMKAVEKARAELCKKNKEFAAHFNYFEGVLSDGQLLAALAGYRLPGAAPLATGDFDQDGLRDLVVADDAEQTVKILFGTSDGRLMAADGIGGTGVGIGPYILSIDDVDEDGNADVVVLNMGSADGSLLLGNGDGTFKDELIFDVRRDGQSTIEVNLNGDTISDRVSIGDEFGTVAVFLNNGERGRGANTPPTIAIPSDGEVDSVLAIDIDGFPGIDLVARLGGSDEVVVYSGFGNATFGPGSFYSYGDTANDDAILDRQRQGGVAPVPGTLTSVLPSANLSRTGVELMLDPALTISPTVVGPVRTIPDVGETTQ